MPHNTIDPVIIAAQLILALQTIVSRNVDPMREALLSVTMIEAGTAFNIIPRTVKLTGTVRTLDEGVRKFMEERVRAVTGGIKAQSKRGGFGTSWWAKRWIQVLEGFDIGSRLGRGRSYARNGQVMDIAIAEGRVRAKVQGSRPEPYAVTIRVKTLSDADWRGVVRALSGETLFAAKLLAGEMPNEIEGVFKTAGLSLFPFVLPSSTMPEAGLTLWDASASHLTLFIMLLATAFFLPLIVLYTGWVFRVMRGPVTTQSLGKNPNAY
jgi:hypothetical protein